MTQESVLNNQEWDSDSNQRPEEDFPREFWINVNTNSVTSGAAMNYVSASGSGVWGPMQPPTNDSIISISGANSPYPNILMNQDVHPTTNPQSVIITPLEFTFTNLSWKYTLAFAFSIFFAPFLIIISKMIGKSTGFRIRR